MNTERRAIALALAAVAMWSTVATGFKLGLRELEPLQLLWLGSLVSWLFFAAAALLTRCRTPPDPMPGQLPGQLPRGRAPSWRQLSGAALLGTLNPFAYYVILFEAYDRLPAQIAQPLNYTWAITLALLAIPALNQKLSRRMAVGIALSYSGVVVLITRGQLTNFTHFDSIGVALALISTVIWAGYWLLTVRATIAPITLMLTSFSVGTPLVGIACHFTSGLPQFSVPNLVFGAWIGLIEMGIAFLLWQRALALTHNAARIGQLIFISPFASFVFIAFALDEAIHVSAVFGLTLIVAGLVAARERSA